MTDSDKIDNNLPVNNNWDQVADALWQQGDRQGAINKILAVITANLPLMPRSAGLQFAYYLFQLQDYATGEKVLSDLLKQYPADLEILENRAVMRTRINKMAGAATDFQQVVVQNPGAVNAWDGLASALHQLQRWDEAQRAGEESLVRKDHRAEAAYLYEELRVNWPDVSPQVWDGQNSGSDVIAFSLWGNNPRYLRGAVRNLQEAPIIYPGWVCRFYVDDSVPVEFVNLAIELGAQVVQQSASQSVRQKLSWRFLVANDPTVRRFLVRDADAVISGREAKAVAEWLESDRLFHVMRDYWTHTDLMLAGMWGGRSGLLPDLAPLVLSYVSGKLETLNIDQWFLRDRVWPLIRSGTLIHDRCFRVLEARVWPEADPPGDWHVGQDESTARSQEQSEKLGALLTEHSWLRLPGLEMVSGFWINLDRAIERRRVMEGRLKDSGMGHYQRVAGVDGLVTYAGLPRPGVMGCWQGHLAALRLGAAGGGVVHVLEDDTLLGVGAKNILDPLVMAGVLENYDVVFTDVLLDYLTSQKYFRAFYEAARVVKKNEVPAKVSLVDLKEILFTCSNSYFIHPQRIGRVLGLLEQEFRSLNLQNPEPIDMVVRRLVLSGAMTAAVTCPFLTSIDLALMADSSINDPANVLLQKTLLLHNIHRQAFFYGADDRSLTALVENLSLTKLRTEKSRLLALLHEQFLVGEQQKF
jgi:tetratricopeptide (TPR) repeat protein/GR25 family glycosyltransferase involved in LPS biosynthesis